MKPENSDDEGNIPDTHNYTEAVGTRLTPKTKRRFDEFRDSEELGNSGALRRLVRRGLDATGDDTATPRLLRTGLIAFLMGYPTAAAVLGYHELAVSFVAITTLAFAIEPQLRTAWQALKSTLKT